jgi:hypothetical protein
VVSIGLEVLKDNDSLTFTLLCMDNADKVILHALLLALLTSGRYLSELMKLSTPFQLP